MDDDDVLGKSFIRNASKICSTVLIMFPNIEIESLGDTYHLYDICNAANSKATTTGDCKFGSQLSLAVRLQVT